MRPNRSAPQSSLGTPVKMGCVPQHDPRDLGRAAAVVRELAERVRAIFLGAGLDRLRETRIDVNQSARDQGRHFAACRTDGRLIVLAPELGLEAFPTATAVGIIAHEFGHASDFAYPGQFVVRSTGALDWYDPGEGKLMPKHLRSAWDGRDEDAVERAADVIAEKVTRSRIGYCGPCSLQTILTGAPSEAACRRPRPRGLR